MPEFTGERVIPGLVDADLFNEHLARYRFAARLVRQRNRPTCVLDAACGAGYGAREFPVGTSVVSVDIAAEAVTLARAQGCRAVQASCEALPFAAASFDVITAFEMIEHLHDPGSFLAGARHVLTPDGVLLVSTPNRIYSEESRAAAGPNPFHTREFEYAEFRTELEKIFPHVQIWTQNHAAGIVFAPAALDVAGSGSGLAGLEAAPGADSAAAHFFLAACSLVPLSPGQAFAWIPDSGNVLRERERHIARLEGELREKDRWRAELHEAHARLQTAHAATEAELRVRNLWAAQLNHEIGETRAIIGQSHAIIEALERDAEERLAWVQILELDLRTAHAEITRLGAEQVSLHQTLGERTDWARAIEAEKNLVIAAYRELEASAEARLRDAAAALGQATERHAQHLRLIAASRWVRLGRKLNVGPDLGQ